MNKRSVWQRVGDFAVGKGFYIVLFLCVATIGISGYYLVSVFSGGEQPEQPVTGGAQVVLPGGDESAAGVQTPQEQEPEEQTPAPAGQSQPDVSAPPAQTEAPAERPQPEQPAQTQPEEPEQLVFTWPVRGEVISSFSLEVLAYDETMGDWRTHSGVDIAAAVGSRVMATAAGTVKEVYEDDLMGTTVVIDHGQGLESRYCNLGVQVTVEQGDEVSTGTVIGAVGETALAEIGRDAHLHFELCQDGQAVDPVGYLPDF